MRRRRIEEQRVFLNVGGKMFETFEKTLQRFPNTLLGDKCRRAKYYNELGNEYFFDFNVGESAFAAILFYYQSSGIMSRPFDVAEEEFQDALRKFEIFQLHIVREDTDLPRNPVARKLWLILEYPETSLAGRIFAHISFVIIMVSSVAFCVQTLDVNRSSLKPKPSPQSLPHTSQSNVWFILESIFISWFTPEYILRLAAAPRKSEFLFSLLGLMDLAAIVPYYVTLIMMQDTSNARSFAIIRAFRLIQAFRIIKLTRHSKSLQLMAKALVYCRDQVGSLLFFLVLNSILGSALMYHFESETNPQFSSIPAAMWFCIISMTTVGYGDIVPITVEGKIAGTLCIISGTITLFHLFLPVYLTYFSLFYNSSKSKKVDR
eukprot:gene10162-11202_t